MKVLESFEPRIISLEERQLQKGDKGDIGERGDPGRDGKDGKNGKDGLNGKDGKDGSDGKNGKVSWEAKPLKRWNGSEWVSADIKYFNGGWA